MRRLFVLPVLLLLSHIAFPQEDEKNCQKVTNPKARKLLEKAKSEKNFDKCRELVDLAAEEEPQFPEAYLFLAKRAKRLEDYKTAIEAYKKVIELCPSFSELPYFDLGTYFFYKEQYDESLKYLKEFTKSEKAKEEQLLFADSLIRVAKILKNKVPFNPAPLEGVCSEKDEYLPIISPDNELAFYTRRYDKIKRGDIMPVSIEEFTFSKRVVNVFDKGDLMPYPFNQNNNEGGASVTVDNNHLFFTICKPEEKIINCDIYTSDFENGSWSEIRNLGPEVNDPKAWDSQPCIDRDGRILYFASNRDSSSGSDIYKTEKSREGKWSSPLKLNNKINTRGNEKSPFVHPDNRTLYFSSDGLPGLGGYDIFFSKTDSTGNWGIPKNIGYPINSEADDLGFFVSTDGKTGYFASNKLKGKGGWDVYSFPLYEGARPEKVLFVKGDLKKENNDTTPINANVELKNIKTNEVSRVSVDSATGHYVGVVNFDSDVIMTIKRKDYAFESAYFSQDDPVTLEPIQVDVPLTRMEVGKSYRLNNIYYETNSAELKGESVAVVREFLEFLEENPAVKIEIQGHTDNVGDDNSNLALSTDRAFTVYDILLQNGISKARLSFKGYGEKKPVAPNDTEENRAKNRRTEFLIIAR